MRDKLPSLFLIILICLTIVSFIITSINNYSLIDQERQLDFLEDSVNTEVVWRLGQIKSLPSDSLYQDLVQNKYEDMNDLYKEFFLSREEFRQDKKESAFWLVIEKIVLIITIISGLIIIYDWIRRKRNG